jgi:DNA polymerase-3 subunit delta'
MTGNWNLTGHNWAVDMLRKHIVRGTTRHAYLFAGPPGLGRRTLALRFAQALNCPTPPEAGIPCGVCRDCKQIEAMQHADLSVVEPTIKDPNNPKELIPSQNGEIRIDQIRNLHKTINLKPYQSKYRVALFLRFHDANDNAANALLKTLEEAPSYAVLILTADNPEQLLPTIVSRCEVLRLRPLPVDEVQKELVTRGLETGRARLIAHISGGRMGYAVRLIENDSLLDRREERLNDLLTLVSASRVEKFKYADQLSKDKDAMRQTITFWLSYWRDVLLRAAQAHTPLVNVDRNVEIEDLAGRMDVSSASRAVRRLESSLEQMDRNVNPRLLAEVLLMDLPKP